MKYFGYILFLFVLLSCGTAPVFEQEVTISEGQWNKDQTIEVVVPVMDTTNRYNLILEMKSDTEYKFQNLYLLIGTKFPDGEKVESPLSLDIADKAGNWKGKCSASYCTTQFYLQQEFNFQEVGEYVLSFKQHSRKQVIENIESLKVILLKVET